MEEKINTKKIRDRVKARFVIFKQLIITYKFPVSREKNKG